MRDLKNKQITSIIILYAIAVFAYSKTFDTALIKTLLFIFWCYCSIILFYRNLKFKFSGMFILFAALIAYLLMHILFSEYKYRVLIFAGSEIAYLLFAYFLYCALDTLKHVKIIVNTVLIILAVILIIGVAQYFGYDLIFSSTGNKIHPYATILNCNYYTAFLCILLPYCLLFFIYYFNLKNKLYALFLLLLALITISIIIIIPHLTPYLCCALLICIFTLQYCLKKYFGVCNNKISAYLSTIIITVFLFVSIFLTTAYILLRSKPLYDLNIFPSKDVISHTALIEDSFEMIKTYPLTGIGHGMFSIEYPKFRRSDYNYNFRLSHNSQTTMHLPLNILVEQGLIGFLIFYGITVLCYYYCFLVFFEPRKKYFLFLSAGIICAMTMFHIYSVTHYLYSFNALPATYWLLIGLSLALKKINFQENPEEYNIFNFKFKIGQFIYMIHFLFCFALSGYLMKVYQSDYYLYNGSKLMNDKSYFSNLILIDRSIDLLARAASLNSYRPVIYYKLGFAHIVKGDYIFKAENGYPKKTAEMFYNKALSIYHDILKLAPLYAQVYNNIGMLYMQLGDVENYLKSFEIQTKLEMHPRNIDNLILQYSKIDSKISNKNKALYWQLKKRELLIKEKNWIRGFINHLKISTGELNGTESVL